MNFRRFLKSIMAINKRINSREFRFLQSMNLIQSGDEKAKNYLLQVYDLPQQIKKGINVDNISDDDWEKRISKYN